MNRPMALRCMFFIIIGLFFYCQASNAYGAKKDQGGADRVRGKKGKSVDKKRSSSIVSALTLKNTHKPIAALVDAYRKDRDDYDAILIVQKGLADRVGKVDESLRVSAALAGEGWQDFTSSKSKKAQERFEGKLRSLCSKCATSLKNVLSNRYNSDGDAKAIAGLKEVIASLELLARRQSQVKKTGKLSATMMRLQTTLAVTAGDHIRIEAAGKWRPGSWTKTNGKTRVPALGTADTYNIVMHIGEKLAGRGGCRWEHTAAKDGKLTFQMAGRNSRKGSASGSLNLRITVTAPKVLGELITTLQGYEEASAALSEEKGKGADTQGKQKAFSKGGALEKQRHEDKAGGPFGMEQLKSSLQFCRRIERRRNKKSGHEAWLWNTLSQGTRRIIIDIALLESEGDITSVVKNVMLKDLNRIASEEGEAGVKKIERLLKPRKSQKR